MLDLLKRTWAEIDLDVLEHNYLAVRSCIKKRTKLCCVIKADAYGHGAVRVAKLYESLGADYFGVSNLEEALQLRLSGINTPILILGYTPAKKASTLANNNITQCVYSADYAVELSGFAQNSGVTVKTHIKIDTGMSRLGFDYNQESTQTIDEVEKICRLQALDFEGAFTHFSVSDEGDDGRDFTKRQYDIFCALLAELENRGIRFGIRHCANSGATLDYPEMQMDMVRAGIILYGLFPSSKSKNRISLSPALELKSVVAYVKTIHEGYTVSYGREYTAKGDTKIATIPIGYADGYPRILGQHHAEVLIGGKRCTITGRVCMDQIMADISALDDVKTGDTVVLIGRSGSETILADEIAKYQESINYEVVCDIGKRVPRVYIKNGKTESISNQILPNNEI